MEKKVLTFANVDSLCLKLLADMKGIYAFGFFSNPGQDTTIKVYPIPRGGIPSVYALMSVLNSSLAKKEYGFNLSIVDTPEECDLFLDDIIDSGATMARYCDGHPGKPFYSLVDKTTQEHKDWGWVVFPWEVTEDKGDESVTDAVTRLLQYVGEKPDRGGLLETPKRVAKAWAHWCSGYGKDAKQILKCFEDGAETCDQMVTVKDIPIYSHCEHHLAPIFGTVTISYIPNGKIVGLSKLSRLADMFARRLQVQERLTNQIADALFAELGALGVGVVIKARHMCMESRGICQQGHHTITTALRGVIKNDASAKAEFLNLAHSK